MKPYSIKFSQKKKKTKCLCRAECGEVECFASSAQKGLGFSSAIFNQPGW